jgi:hypothetical protein
MWRVSPTRGGIEYFRRIAMPNYFHPSGMAKARSARRAKAAVAYFRASAKVM